MTNEQEWAAMMADDGWVLLSHDHPDYSIQQAFCEVAFRSREQDPDKLYRLAIEDYENYAPKADERIQTAFRKWAAIQANNNVLMANDPWFQGLEAAENIGPEACDKFMADNPRGPFEPLGKD